MIPVYVCRKSDPEFGDHQTTKGKYSSELIAFDQSPPFSQSERRYIYLNPSNLDSFEKKKKPIY